MSFNLAVILSESAHAGPARPVAVFDGGQLSYRDLDQASDLAAAALAAAGIQPGDRVALQLPSIPQFLISYFGILKAGGVVVPLNVLLRAPEIAFHLGDSGARVLITWEGVLAEAAVVGVPDERLGEEVLAVVIVRTAMDLHEHELVSWCRERLAAYKCPRVFQFRDELPKNTLGKVLEDELARGWALS